MVLRSMLRIALGFGRVGCARRNAEETSFGI
jgi:hypothetical protein